MNKMMLQDIADIFNGKTPSKIEQRATGFPVLKIKDIDESGERRGDYGSFVEEEFVLKFPNKVLRDLDVLVLNAAHNSAYVGSKTCLVTDKLSGSLATGEWTIIRAKQDKVDPKYIYFYITSNIGKMEIKNIVKGIHLYPKDLNRIQIFVPDMDSQAEIVKTLNQSDSLRKKRKQAINLLDRYLKSVFLEMFGDPVINSKNWELRKFNEVGTLERGKSKHRPRNAPELLGGKYPLIQTGDVANSEGYIKEFNQTYSELGLKQSRMWPVGTLCITIAANIAKTGILTFEACFPDSIVGFTPNNKVRTEYVQVWMGFLQKILEDKAPESAQKNINLEILRNLDIPIPPIELQNKFVDIVEQTEDTKKKMMKQSEELNLLFQSLLQKSFSSN